MRHKVKLETLSSVHVGSGDKKVLGIDFLYSPKRIYFLDTLRIGEAIDITANLKIATEWSKSVLDGKQEEFFIDHNVDYRKLSRSVVNYVDEFSDRAPSISMMMRDGRGIAYIPGSSIKGAIRTAIFAQMAENDTAGEWNLCLQRGHCQVCRCAYDQFSGLCPPEGHGRRQSWPGGEADHQPCLGRMRIVPALLSLIRSDKDPKPCSVRVQSIHCNQQIPTS